MPRLGLRMPSTRGHLTYSQRQEAIKRVTREERHQQIVDILNREAVCDVTHGYIKNDKGIPSFCFVVNAEELAKKIEELYDRA